MVKRIVSFLLICSLVFTFAVPASASGIVPDSIVDLYNAVDYQLYVHGNLMSTFSMPNISSPGAYNIEWRFSPSSTDLFKGLILTVRMAAGTTPSKLQVWVNGYYYDLELIHNDGEFYYYRFDAEGSFMVSSGLRLYGEWSVAYKGYFNLVSIHGISDQAVNVDTVYGWSDWIGQSNTGEQLIIPGSKASYTLPKAFEWYQECIDGINDNSLCIDYAAYYWRVDPADDLIDTMSFLVYALGDLYNVGVSIVDGNNVSAILPVSIDYAGETQVLFETEFAYERVKAYLITADVYGYDLADLEIQLSYCEHSSPYSAAIEMSDCNYSCLNSVAYIRTSSDQPWYVSFAQWLKTQFNNVISAVSNGFSSVIGWLESIAQDVHEGFSSVWETLQGIYSALTGDQGAADDFNSELETQKGELEEITGALDSVTTPNVDDIELDFSGLKTGDNGEDFALFFSVFFSNEIFLGMALIGVTLSLAAYALYGKR